MDLSNLLELGMAVLTGVAGHYGYTKHVAPKLATKRMHKARAKKAVATKKARKASVTPTTPPTPGL